MGREGLRENLEKKQSSKKSEKITGMKISAGAAMVFVSLR